MERFEDWPQRLTRCAIEAQSRPFVWGAHDCATFAADCVLEMTGVDLIEGMRGRYDGPISAAKLIKNEGFDDLGDIVSGILEEIDVDRCARGDVVLCEGEEGDFLAIVVGLTAVGPTEAGLRHVPLPAAKRGFRV